MAAPKQHRAAHCSPECCVLLSKPWREVRLGRAELLSLADGMLHGRECVGTAIGSESACVLPVLSERCSTSAVGWAVVARLKAKVRLRCRALGCCSACRCCDRTSLSHAGTCCGDPAHHRYLNQLLWGVPL